MFRLGSTQGGFFQAGICGFSILFGILAFAFLADYVGHYFIKPLLYFVAIFLVAVLVSLMYLAADSWISYLL